MYIYQFIQLSNAYIDIFTVTYMHIYKYLSAIRHTYFLLEDYCLLLADEYYEKNYEMLEGHKS